MTYLHDFYDTPDLFASWSSPYRQRQLSSDRLPDNTLLDRTRRGSFQSHASASTLFCRSLDIPDSTSSVDHSTSSPLATFHSIVPCAANGPPSPANKRPTQRGRFDHAESPLQAASMMAWDKALPALPRDSSLFGKLVSVSKELPKIILGTKHEEERASQTQTAPPLLQAPRLPPPPIVVTSPLPFLSGPPSAPPLRPRNRIRPPRWIASSYSSHRSGDSATWPTSPSSALMQEIASDPALVWLEQLGVAALQKRGKRTGSEPQTPVNTPCHDEETPGFPRFSGETEETPTPVTAAGPAQANLAQDEIGASPAPDIDEETTDVASPSSHDNEPPVQIDRSDKHREAPGTSAKDNHPEGEQAIPVGNIVDGKEDHEEQDWVEVDDEELQDRGEISMKSQAQKPRAKGARKQRSGERTRRSWFVRRSATHTGSGRQSPQESTSPSRCPKCGAPLPPSTASSSKPANHSGVGRCSHPIIETHHTGDFILMNISNMNNNNSRRYYKVARE
ncbi:hypothetical protein NLJ89_g6778 [Agrocybe chaxingu]|uniref:Uncharacterized protein n=1 Tax=Agrocybe chaxingu TaxID=84603 RepID=A0A9W8JXY3_9AGAR|nr:hypothetical protein NLJ89_g6778 [Agrocybe chaxingu]